MHNISFTYRTIFSDLDTQQHLNSNKYFDLFESGKYLLLDKLGLTKEILTYGNNNLNQNNTQFKFINQVKDNVQLDINISLNVYKKGVLEWFGTISNCEKKCFEINSVNKCNAGILNNLITKDEEMTNSSTLLNIQTLNEKKYSHDYKLRFIERNYFGNIPENISWKLFEDTRWNQLRYLGLSLDELNKMDIAFFWRDSEYKFSNNFNVSQEITSNVWIDSIDNIRVIFAHEMLNRNKEVICNSINTFVSVSISKQRPKRIPKELIVRFEKYIK